jgi:hypothetical protein
MTYTHYFGARQNIAWQQVSSSLAVFFGYLPIRRKCQMNNTSCCSTAVLFYSSGS